MFQNHTVSSLLKSNDLDWIALSRRRFEQNRRACPLSPSILWFLIISILFSIYCFSLLEANLRPSCIRLSPVKWISGGRSL